MASVTRSWGGEDVNINAVKSALVQLIRELNPPRGTGQPHPPVRASLLSRIVRVAKGADESRAREALEELAELRPARTLVVAVDPAAPPGLDAYATARCQLRSGTEPRVCSEEVRLTARGDLANHLASVLAPLLIPDMPVVLWWIGDPPQEDEELLHLCDRLVLDSDLAGPAALPGLARLVEILGPRRIVTDLAWAELSPWRELLAQLFDPVETRPFQRTLKALEIEYGAGVPTTRPLLLVGWLAASLGWSLEEPVSGVDLEEPRLTFRSPAGPVDVQIQVAAGRAGLESGALLRVALEARWEGLEATFEIARHEDGVCATARTSLPGRPEQVRVVPLERPSWATLLSGELDRRRADPVYRASLALTAGVASA